MIMFRPLLKYADFSGRARRSEYWLFQLFQVIVYALAIMLAISGAVGAHDISGAVTGSLLSMAVIGLFALACFLPNLAVTVRRLHDSGKPAWFLALYAPGIINAMLGMQTTSAIMSGRYEAASAAMQQSTILSMIGILGQLAMLVLMVLPGTRGPNRFGPDPKGDGTEIAAVFDAPEPEPAQTSREPHKPVFDFGPSRGVPAVREAAPIQRPAPSPTAGYGASAARPTFGKRR